MSEGEALTRKASLGETNAPLGSETSLASLAGDSAPPSARTAAEGADDSESASDAWGSDSSRSSLSSVRTRRRRTSDALLLDRMPSPRLSLDEEADSPLASGTLSSRRRTLQTLRRRRRELCVPLFCSLLAGRRPAGEGRTSCAPFAWPHAALSQALIENGTDAERDKASAELPGVSDTLSRHVSPRASTERVSHSLLQTVQRAPGGHAGRSPHGSSYRSGHAWRRSRGGSRRGGGSEGACGVGGGTTP